MMKKVFALVVSRSSKKVTYNLVDNILMEISKKSKINYEILRIGDFKINPCLGCSECFKMGYCVQKDDLNLLKEKILSSDLFVIAAPVYMHGLPGEMKNIIDRLATWAHTFRLAGKNILIVSSCSNNGHTTVVDDLHIKMLYMGGRIIGKYVGTNFIPSTIKTDSNIMLLDNSKELIPELVKKTIENWESKFCTNKFNESLFKVYRDRQKYLLDMNQCTGETEYWIKTGMIECLTLQEYIDKLFERSKN